MNWDSPKSSLPRKRPLLNRNTPSPSINSALLPPELLSQSEVTWQYEAPISPRENNLQKKYMKLSNDPVQTPIRIVKRHASSPAVTQTSSLFEKHLNDSFNISGDDYQYDLDDEEILAAVLALEQSGVKETDKQKERSENVKSESSAASSRPAGLQALLEDSFDDVVLSSIPVDDFREKNKKVVSVKVTYKEGSGVALPDKSSCSMPRYNISEPSIKHSVIAVKRTEVGTKQTKLFERHNSLPAQSRFTYRTQPEVAQTKINLTNSLVTGNYNIEVNLLTLLSGTLFILPFRENLKELHSS